MTVSAEPTLIVEASADRLRGVLFTGVEGQIRFVGDARCPRGSSLSAAVEELASRLAGQTGLAASQIQRNPLFVISGPEDLGYRSVRAVDRMAATTHCCLAIARERDEAVIHIAADAPDGLITIVRAGPDGRPDIESHPTPIDGSRDRRRAIGRGEFVLAGTPFTNMGLGVALLTIADMVQPGVDRTEIAVDRDGLAAVAGALDGDALASVVMHDLLASTHLVLVVNGEGEPGRLAARGVVETTDGTVARFSVPWGAVQLVLSPSWHGGSVTIAGQGAANVGEGQPVCIDVGARGYASILIDARGHLRSSTPNPSQMDSWLADVLMPAPR